MSLSFVIFKTFLLLLAAHLVGDVFFNSYRLAVLKRSSGFLQQAIGAGCHSGVHLFFAAMLLFLGDRPWVPGALMVFVSHLVIDLVRSGAEKRRYGQGRVHVTRSEFTAWLLGKSENPEKMNFRGLRPWFLLNIFDQGAHLACLLAISLLL